MTNCKTLGHAPGTGLSVTTWRRRTSRCLCMECQLQQLIEMSSWTLDSEIHYNAVASRSLEQLDRTVVRPSDRVDQYDWWPEAFCTGDELSTMPAMGKISNQNTISNEHSDLWLRFELVCTMLHTEHYWLSTKKDKIYILTMGKYDDTNKLL